MTADIEEARDKCRTCHRNAPSQAKLPPTAPKLPTTPFQMIYADYLQLVRKHYLIIGDRLSGWTEVVKADPGTSSSGSKGLCDALRNVFVSFGVPEELSSDGGPEFVSAEATDFYCRWGVTHRISSAYFPQSNGRAEVAVKLTKRLLEDNVDANGNLNTDKVVRALLQQRNTPDRDCQLSPAQIIFGRTLRDTMPQLDKSVPIFESDRLHNQWHQAWSAKEQAIRSRLIRSCEDLEEGSRELPVLREGDSVLIQNQDKSSGRPNKWDRQGKIVAAKPNDQYLVKVDGSGRLTLRNRRFLRKYSLRSATIQEPQYPPEHMSHGPTPRNPTPTQEEVIPPASTEEEDVVRQRAHRDNSSTSPKKVQFTDPYIAPNAVPGAVPNASPIVVPSTVPIIVPSVTPDTVPSTVRNGVPSIVPSVMPCAIPSIMPCAVPGARPSIQPRSVPKVAPTNVARTIDGSGAATNEEPRRSSSRVRMQRTVYDAATGSHVNPAVR